MIHRFTVGFIDVAAVSRRQTVSLSELSDDVRRLVHEHAEPGSVVQESDEVRFAVGGQCAVMMATFVQLPWWSPGLNVPAVRLAIAASNLGCVVADVAHARVVSCTELEEQVL
jgi:hypothetical protein